MSRIDSVAPVRICAADNHGVHPVREAFNTLERAGIADRALADDLRNMARFRSRIVHLSESDLRKAHG